MGVSMNSEQLHRKRFTNRIKPRKIKTVIILLMRPDTHSAPVTLCLCSTKYLHGGQEDRRSGFSSSAERSWSWGLLRHPFFIPLLA